MRNGGTTQIGRHERLTASCLEIGDGSIGGEVNILEVTPTHVKHSQPCEILYTAKWGATPATEVERGYAGHLFRRHFAIMVGIIVTETVVPKPCIRHGVKNVHRFIFGRNLLFPTLFAARQNECEQQKQIVSSFHNIYNLVIALLI